MLFRSAIILASGLYAYYVIEPVNLWLYTFEADAPESVARELMRDWGLVEWGLTVIGLWACGIFAWTIVVPA